MSMHQGLDLSKFKAVSSDAKTTTLRHAKGHEVKIAHGSVSPKMREALAALPKYMAEGGEADDDGGYFQAGDNAGDGKWESGQPDAMPEERDAAAEEPDSGEEEQPEAEPEAGQPEAEAPAAPQEEAAAPAAPEPETEQASATIPPKPPSRRPEDVPESNAVDVVGHRRPPPPTKQELDNEDALFAQDMQRGHIKPETMQGLYDKKDTLGKIGTLFGLLVSGMGSGLTGQPNVVLEMMKNQIANDLEAQKASNVNAQNWLRLSQAHEMQKAQIGRMGVENELSKAQAGESKARAGKIPSEIAVNKAHLKNLDADTDLKATAAAKNRMMLGVLGSLTETVDKMPPGPSKDAATKTLNDVVTPAIQQELGTTNAQTAGQLQLRAAVRGETPKPQQSPIDDDKLNDMQKKGALAAAMGVPGAAGMSPADISKTVQEADKVKENRALYGTWMDVFKKLDDAHLGGKLTPGFVEAAITPLVGLIGKSTTGVYNPSEAKAQASAMFPSPLEWDKTRNEKFDEGVGHFRNMEAGTTNLDRYKLKRPFPEPPADMQPKNRREAGGAKEHYKTDKNGVRWKRGKNGEAIRVN